MSLSDFERRVLARTQVCRNFNGIQHECCSAGVRYHDLADGIGCALRYPCLPHPTADCEKFPIVECSKRTLWSKEDAEKDIREDDEQLDRFLKAVPLAHADAKGKGLGKPTKKSPELEGGTGEMPCPMCSSGTLQYVVSDYNGHMHAQCTTANCLNWME